MLIASTDECGMAEFDDSITCVVYLMGCDMNCEYCHNDSLIKVDMDRCVEMSADELAASIKWNTIDWVSITGGEPLAHDDFDSLKEFIKIVKSKKKKLNMDTNGKFTIEKHARLQEIGKYLDCLSVDIKSFSHSYVDRMARTLKELDLLGKCRFRTVIIDDIAKEYFNITAGFVLRCHGIRDIKVLRNSFGGRGKNFGQTSDKLVSEIKSFYRTHGLRFHDEKLK